MGKGYEVILPQGKGLHISRTLPQVVAIYKADEPILSKKYLSVKTRGSKKYFTQKAAAPNFFYLTNQLHVLCLSLWEIIITEEKKLAQLIHNWHLVLELISYIKFSQDRNFSHFSIRYNWIIYQKKWKFCYPEKAFLKFLVMVFNGKIFLVSLLNKYVAKKQLFWKSSCYGN